MSSSPDFCLAIESPDQPAVRALVAQLDAYQSALYPAESNHLLDVEALAGPDVRFAVARDVRGEAIGCGAVMLASDPAELKRMFVLPARRGGGIAKALLAFLEDACRAEGRAWLALETGISQPEAIGLYERAGFERCGPFGDYRPDPLSLFMRKRLSAG